MDKINAKQRILARLLGGPAPLHELRRIGGQAADVRIRELRRLHGIPIKYRHRIVQGKATNTTIYYIDAPTNEIDINRIQMKSNENNN